MAGFRIEREESDHLYFARWSDYLTHRADAGDRSLCRILRKNTLKLNELIAGPEDESASEQEEREQLQRAKDAGQNTRVLAERLALKKRKLEGPRRRAAFPWVTPVLGTGCLSTSEFSGRDDVGLMPARLQQEAASWKLDELHSGGHAVDVIVLHFAKNLVQSRAPQAEVKDRVPWVNRADPDPSPHVVSLAARAAWVSALLTKLFHRAAALMSRPIGHQNEQTSLPDNKNPDAAVIRKSLVEPLVLNLEKFVSLAAEYDALEFLNEYLERLVWRVRRVEFSLVDVELLTEITWHLMMRDNERYAGWSDLLALVGIKSGSYGPHRRGPLLADLGAEDGLMAWLIGGLEKTTQNSWESRLADASSDREEFYDAVADMIIAQAKLDALRSDKATRDADRYLPGVAFITSFDLELEMALHAKQQKFVLVAPFELWRGEGTQRRAHLAWFYRIVDIPSAGPSLDWLRGDGDWRLLRESALRANETPDTTLRGMPFVVRLTGCPLVQGLEMDTTTTQHLIEAQFPGASEGVLDVGHAVLLDEHTSLHHWTAELRETIRLPRELVAHEEGKAQVNGDRRFWMLLGVQITDDAIRHRVAAVVASHSIRGEKPPKIGEGKPHNALELPWTGVVVNSRSEPAQRDIFQWQGLDVVGGLHNDVQKSLRHYTRHLLAPETRPVRNEICMLGPADE